MQRRHFVAYVLERGAAAAVGGAACSAAGCGTFIHPERCGQPHSHQIDWKIVALDGLGLLLFFVPGVVAFVVDFWTGAIYLPMCEAYPGYGAYGPLPPGTVVLPPGHAAMPVPATAVPPSPGPSARTDLGFRRLAIPQQELQPERIEQIVSQHVGRPVPLADSPARVSALARIEQFEEQTRRHREESAFGVSIRSFFDRFTS